MSYFQADIMEKLREGWRLSDAGGGWWDLVPPPLIKPRQRIAADGRSVRGLLKRGIIKKTSVGAEYVNPEERNK